jgi:hypothetical protein
MLKSSVRRAALVLSGSAVVLAGLMLPAQAATSGWRVAATVTATGREVLLTAIAAPAANDAWASGISVTSSGKDTLEVMDHWNGRSWKQASLPSAVAKVWASPAGAFQVVGASSSRNVWAFSEVPASKSESATYLRLSGRKWTTGTLPDSSASAGHEVLVNSVEVFSSSNVWAFGGRLAVTGSDHLSAVPYAVHFNGYHWSVVAVPGSDEITAVSAVTSSNMWAVTGTSAFGAEFGLGGSARPASAVLHWNGSKWQLAAVQPSALPSGANLTAISAARGNRLAIGGDVENSQDRSTSAFVDQFNGAAWSARAALPKFGAGGDVASLVPNGNGGLWALSTNLDGSRSQLWQYAVGRWSSPASPKFGSPLCELMQLAAVSGGKSVWAATTAGTDKSPHGVVAVEGPTPR